MTTRRRAWIVRLGLTALLAAGGLAAATTPALAAPGDVTVDAPGSFDLRAGETRTLTITVTNHGNAPVTGVRLELRLPSNFSGDDINMNPPSGCTGSPTATCRTTLGPNESKSFDFDISAQKDGANKTGQAQATAGNSSKSINFTLQGNQPEKKPIGGVSGTVTDETTGKAVSGARVTLQDSAGKTCQSATNGQGKYSFGSSCGGVTVTAGTIAIAAQKDGFDAAQINLTVKDGENKTGANIRMKSKAGPSATATPSAEPLPSDAGAAAPSEGSATPNANTKNTSSDTGLSTLSWVLIGFGMLLILIPVVLVIIVILRRKKGDQDDEGDDGFDGDDPRGGPPGGAGTPQARGVYHGAGGYDDRTSVMGAGPADGGAMAEAPTIMHTGPLVSGDGYEQPTTVGRSYGGQTESYGQQTQIYGGSGGGGAAYGGGQGGSHASDRGGSYGSGGGYGDETRTYQAGGAQQPNGTQRGYDDRPYQPPPHQQPQHGGDRRPLDWLDD